MQTHILYFLSQAPIDWEVSLFCKCMAFVYGTSWLVWHVLVFNSLFNKQCINAGKETALVKPSHWVLTSESSEERNLSMHWMFCIFYVIAKAWNILNGSVISSCCCISSIIAAVFGLSRCYECFWSHTDKSVESAEVILLIHKPQKEKSADITQRIKHNPTNTLLEHINKME